MRIKATIVAYLFLVQCFENATIVAYVGLRDILPASVGRGSTSKVSRILCNMGCMRLAK